jgi:hypothetical protein
MLPSPVTGHPLPAGKIAGGWLIQPTAPRLVARGDSPGAEILYSFEISVNLTVRVKALNLQQTLRFHT